MATVMSPPLKDSCGDLETKRRPWADWFCLDVIRRFFKLPREATTYWVEARNRQWSDKSGQSCRVKFNELGDPVWENNSGWSLLYTTLTKPLRKLGVTTTPKTIYICLWYEE